MLDKVQSDEGDSPVDAVQDHLRHERADLHRLEDGGAVVEEVIGSRQLLEHLEAHAQQDSVPHARCPAHADEFADRVALGLHFGTKFVFNLLHLHVDAVMMCRGTVDLHQRLLGTLRLSLAVVISRRFREEENADTKHDGPKPAESNDDAPRAGIRLLMGVRAIVEAGGQEDAQRDKQLICANQGSSNPRWGCLGLIHWDEQTQSTNPKTGDETADHDLNPAGIGSNLDHKTDSDDEAPDGNGHPTADAVSDGSCHQGANQRANRQLQEAAVRDVECSGMERGADLPERQSDQI